MIMPVVVQKADIGSEAVLEDNCVGMEVAYRCHAAKQIYQKVLQLSACLVEDPR